MKRKVLKLFPVLLAGALLCLGVACGLKGPPIPPEVKGKSGAESSIQIGKKPVKEPPEEELILKLYGRENRQPNLSGLGETFGIGAFDEQGNPIENKNDKTSETQDSGTAPDSQGSDKQEPSSGGGTENKEGTP
jgi:hypothetical protein